MSCGPDHLAPAAATVGISKNQLVGGAKIGLDEPNKRKQRILQQLSTAPVAEARPAHLPPSHWADSIVDAGNEAERSYALSIRGYLESNGDVPSSRGSGVADEVSETIRDDMLQTAIGTGVKRCVSCGRFVGNGACVDCPSQRANLSDEQRESIQALGGTGAFVLPQQAWQMSEQEWKQGKPKDGIPHYLHVKRALASGEPVPDSALAAHRDLAPAPASVGDSLPPAFETQEDFARWLNANASKAAGGLSGWTSLNEAEGQQAYMAVFCEHPQDVKTMQASMNYIIQGEMRLQEFGPMEVDEAGSDAPQSKDGYGRMFYFYGDWGNSKRHDIRANLQERLIPQLEGGTPIRKTNRAGAGTMGTRTFEPVKGRVYIAVADKAKADEQAVTQALSELSPALHEFGVPVKQAYQAAIGQLHKYIPRCAKCGRFLPTQDPTCHNPRCQLQGERQYDPVKWPPEGFTFKNSKAKSPAPKMLTVDDLDQTAMKGSMPLSQHEYETGSPDASGLQNVVDTTMGDVAYRGTPEGAQAFTEKTTAGEYDTVSYERGVDYTAISQKMSAGETLSDTEANALEAMSAKNILACNKCSHHFSEGARGSVCPHCGSAEASPADTGTDVALSKDDPSALTYADLKLIADAPTPAASVARAALFAAHHKATTVNPDAPRYTAAQIAELADALQGAEVTDAVTRALTDAPDFDTAKTWLAAHGQYTQSGSDESGYATTEQIAVRGEASLSATQLPEEAVQSQVTDTPTGTDVELTAQKLPGSIQTYIKKIRNKDKKQYATAYARWLGNGKAGDEPSRGKLSVMAAQAVRFQMAELLKATDGDDRKGDQAQQQTADFQTRVSEMSDAEREAAGITKCGECGNFVSLQSGEGHKPNCQGQGVVASSLIEAADATGEGREPLIAPPAAHNTDTDEAQFISGGGKPEDTVVFDAREVKASDSKDDDIESTGEAKVAEGGAAAISVPTRPLMDHEGDFVMSEAFGETLGHYTEKERYNKNVEAIRLLKKLEAENLEATPEEQATLAQYTGWGALPGVFDDVNDEWKDLGQAFEGSKPETWGKVWDEVEWDTRNAWAKSRGLSYYNTPGHSTRITDSDWAEFQKWHKERKPKWWKEHNELKSLLPEMEYEEARATTPNAHYTSIPVVRGVWEAAKHMGFEGGIALEPSMGTGNFFGAMPEDVANHTKKVGVEIDPTTARIAKKLYPKAHIEAKGFEETKFPDGFFDLAISNVPFGSYGIADPAFLKGDRKKMADSIHNYFFAKTMDKVKPGGVIAFVTSRFTLDGQDPSVREYLAKQGDFVGAMRLPNTAFKGNAGTEVTTDVIFLHKRKPGEPEGDRSWIETKEITGADGSTIRVNAYYADHPEMMLGKMASTGRMYGANEPTLEPDDRNLHEAMREAVARLPKNVTGRGTGKCSTCGNFISAQGEGHKPECGQENQPVGEFAPAPETTELPTRMMERYEENAFAIGEDGKVYRKVGDRVVVHPDYAKAKKDGPEPMSIQRVKGLAPLADLARQAMELNVNFASDQELAVARERLNTDYDGFVEKYGPVHSFANLRAMANDPNLPYLLALEDYSETARTAKKAAIFFKRTIEKTAFPDHADTAQDAMLLALAETGELNWSRMSGLTGQSIEAMQAELQEQGLVFPTPDNNWATRDEYLSGNVRKKLREAQGAAALDPRFQKHVEALEAVQPRDLTPDEIAADLGVSWIPASDIEDFTAHMLRGHKVHVHYSPHTGWSVDKPTSTWIADSTENTQKWGYSRDLPATELLGMALNGKEPTVYDRVPNPDDPQSTIRVVNQDKTIAARDRVRAMREEYRKWMWSDEKRAARLGKEYNERYNAIAERKYDGSHLRLPGLGADANRPRSHQLDAIWRGMQGENVLFAHRVGAGKTDAAIGSGMELKRIGKRKNIGYVVPNNVLAQWGAAFYRMYPGKKILMVNAEDISSTDEAKRKEFAAKVLTGDWDAVVFSHTAFERLPVERETYERYIQRDIDELREALHEQKKQFGSEREAKRSRTVKEIERGLKRAEARLQKYRLKSEGKADKSWLSFEKLGFDQLIVDEAHYFKNAPVTTKMDRVKGLNTKESERAYDMLMKVRHVRDVVHKGEDRGVMFLTGTPVANAIQEGWIMQRYLNEKHQREVGLETFDAFAKNFGRAVQRVEMNPTGKGYSVQTSFSHVVNLPEFVSQFHHFADVRMDAEKMKLPLPKVKGDKPTVLTSKASPKQKQFIDQLVVRAKTLRDPRKDNMLKIVSDGRKTALDMRLLNPNAPDDPGSKVNRCVQNIISTYQEGTNAEIALRDGTKRRANKTQLVFCDLGVPQKERKEAKTLPLPKEGVVCEGCGRRRKPGHAECLIGLAAHNCPTDPKFSSSDVADENGRFDLYNDMKRKLVDSGIPEHEVAFMQDADSDEKKLELFAKVNDGKVRVLIGSTRTMGVGVNVQQLVGKMHMLTLPWRPDEMEQAEGRGIRQGNWNEEVELVRYATEGTFDVYQAQLLEKKQRFISKMVAEDMPIEREASDDDAATLTFAELKAIATGDQRIIEKAGLERDVAALTALEKAHKERVFKAQHQLQGLPDRIDASRKTMGDLEESVALVKKSQADEEAAVAEAKANLEESRAWARKTKETVKALESKLKESPGDDEATLAALKAELAEAQEQAETAEAAAKYEAESFKENAGFKMTLNGKQYTNSDDAGITLRSQQDKYSGTGGDPVQIGEYRNFPLYVQPTTDKAVAAPVYIRIGKYLRVISGSVNFNGAVQSGGDPFGINGRGNVARVRNMLEWPMKTLKDEEAKLADLEKQAAPLQEIGLTKFEKAEELATKRDRLTHINTELDAENAKEGAQVVYDANTQGDEDDAEKDNQREAGEDDEEE